MSRRDSQGAALAAPRTGERLRQFFLPPGGRARPAPWVVVALLAAGCGAALALTDTVQRADWALYDRFARVAASAGVAPQDIVVVAIDEPSFREIGMPWPWPRRLHAALVRTLAAAGARTIVFDVVFDVASSRDDDAAFVDAVRAAGNVVLGSDLAVVTDRAYSLTQWADPFADLGGAAAAVGIVRVELDPDGVLRRAPLAVAGRAGLALSAARRQRGFVEPPDTTAARLIRFSGPPRQGITTVSYYQALDVPGSVPVSMFRDKVVFVGRSLAVAAASDEVPDHFATPVALRMAGVEVHASLLDTLLRDRAIADPFATPARSALLAGLVALAVGLFLYRLAPVPGLAFAAGGALAVGLAAWGLFTAGHARLPVVAPTVAVLTGWAATSAYRQALGLRERRFITRAFQHYVSPVVVEQMLREPDKLGLAGEEYEATVLFTDLAGFTSLSERLDPREARARLSEFFEAMLEILLAERATLDKLIGDAIMVFFGCPIRDPAHAQQACRGAIAMERRLDALVAGWTAHGLPPLRMRTGINSGRLIAGNMGTRTIFNYTVIGDTVNLASRLEGLNKSYGTRTMVGQDTRARLGEAFVCRELDTVRVPGRATPVTVYELAGEAGQVPALRQDVHSEYADALAHYRARRWGEAALALEQALGLDAGDGPSRALLGRCRAYAATPPPPEWDGVADILSK